jgi:small subunit ribosomal protein S20
LENEVPVQKSAKKSVRQYKEARTRNRIWKSRIKTAGKKVENAIEKKEHDALQPLFKEYVSVVDRAASKGVIHKNNAARKKMKMAQRMKTGAEPKGRNEAAAKDAQEESTVVEDED